MKNTKTEREFTNLVFPSWMLPGEWKTLEVLTDRNTQTVSYTMATKLHPNAKPYVDFWGNVDPYGPGKNLVFVNIHEFRKSHVATGERFSVSTGRNTHSDMTTTKFHRLEDAIKHAVNEMVKTTKKFDKINKRKTQIWAHKDIIANDPNFNSVK